MAGEWVSATVGDAFDLVNGYAFKSEEFIGQGVPVIKIKNVKAGEFSEHEFSYVSEKFLIHRSNKLACFADLLISMSGNRHDGSPDTWVGKVAQFRKRGNFFINQRVGALRAKKDVEVDSRFASYVLSSKQYQYLFIAIATSSGGQANLSPAQILGASFRYPSVLEQRTIAHILGTLDDKIELNRRRNQTLEAMARAVFQDWFVDFGPIRAKMEGREPYLPTDIWQLFPDSLDDEGKPEGWKAKTVGECFSLTMGQSPPGETYNDAGDGLPFFQGKTDFGFRYPENRKYCSAPTRIANAEDTLVSVRAPVGDINLAWEKCCVGRGVAAIRHKSGARSFSYHAIWSIQAALKQFEHTGTVFGAISKKQFELLSFLDPTHQLVDAYESVAGLFDDKIRNNIEESRTLTRLRDTLLPKLISGDLRVADAERFAEHGGF